MFIILFCGVFVQNDNFLSYVFKSYKLNRINKMKQCYSFKNMKKIDKIINSMIKQIVKYMY